jgi:hypothetical protein
MGVESHFCNQLPHVICAMACDSDLRYFGRARYSIFVSYFMHDYKAETRKIRRLLSQVSTRKLQIGLELFHPQVIQQIRRCVASGVVIQPRQQQQFRNADVDIHNNILLGHRRQTITPE